MPTTLLTKSLLLKAIECPTKLYYATHAQYANQMAIDPFLEALAEGGYQVGQLAKLRYPDGIEISSLDIGEAVAETANQLQKKNVTLFEAAIRYNNLLVRIDILIKKDDHFQLIEVKAKSIDHNKKSILSKNGKISSDWRRHIIDVAYQTHVLQCAYPNSMISSHLLLANKNSTAATDGLNQKFKLVRDLNQRKSVIVSDDLCSADLTSDLLIEVDANAAVKSIFTETSFSQGFFTDEIHFLAEKLKLGEKIYPATGGKCKKCEFFCTDEDEKNGLISGFKECWKQTLNWTEEDFQQPNVLEISGLKVKALDKLFANNKIYISDLSKDDLGKQYSASNGLSSPDRRWLQIEKIQNNDTSPYIDVKAMKAKFSEWTYPLHFIDFETTKIALPFFKGHRPYELIAFQFSHHTVDCNGVVTHAGEYLNAKPGVFPNYDFVRKLRDNLSIDKGTIFQYSTFENTTLNQIFKQLNRDENPPLDKDELCSFIKSVTKSSEKSIEKHRGNRCMVDMHEIVKLYYYDPATHGSNSIKDVLPAMLNSSQYLKDKYCKPIYGAENGIKSHNFQNWTWLNLVNGKPVNPYDRLPKLFEDYNENAVALLTRDDSIQEGGAAMTAYAKMQYSEMSDYERTELCKALLKYCELDSLAMVMLFEGWREMLK